ncbi:MAG: hypothetical protein H6623_05520 [Bdellovibrionaceae bacterium]|nr:hypothetical protein [Pseudobdellovibrionaceae bacterium]
MLYLPSYVYVAVGSMAGCAYHFGPYHRELPGGLHRIYVAQFENRTQEVGIEPDITDAFIQEMARSGVGDLTTDASQAEVVLQGVIHTVDFLGKTSIELPVSDNQNTPRRRSMFTEYQTRMTIILKAVNKKDEELWQGQFMGEKNYKAPQLTTYGLRTANPLYNQNAKRRTIRAIAKDMATEAISRMTENF